MAEKKEVKKEAKKETKKEVKEKNYTFYEAMVKALSEMPDKLPMREGQIGHRKYMYVSLDTIINTVRPILARYGLAITQDVQINSRRIKESTPGETIEYEVSVATILLDGKGGLYSSSWVRSPIVSTVGGNTLQAIGATITYLRRYSISAFLGIATEEDTDAETVVSDKAKKANGEAYLKYKEKKKDSRPPEVKAKLKEIQDKIIEARDLGILDTNMYLKQRSAISKITTMSGALAFEEMVLRLIDTEHKRKAEALKEQEAKIIDSEIESIEVPSEQELEEDNLFEGDLNE